MQSDELSEELLHPHLITVIIIVVTVVLGFAIIFTLRHSYAATKIVVKDSHSKTAGSQQVSTADADQYVAKFYKEYSAAASKAEPFTTKKQIVAKYGTYQVPQYYTPPKGYHYDRDPIFCATLTPTRVDISSKPSATASVDVTIREKLSNGSAQVVMSVAKQPSGELKIAKVDCNPPLYAQPN